MSDRSKQLPQNRNAIDDGDDALNDTQDMDIAFNINGKGGWLSQESDLTFVSNTVDNMLLASVGNLDKSIDGTLGDTENIECAVMSAFKM